MKGDEFTVLITDDDPVTLYMHKLCVKKSGLSQSFVGFSSANETLEYLDASHGSGVKYLILLDINMPVMSGWELLDSIIKREYGGINVVMVSSSVNVEDYRKAESYDQVVGFIEKPLSQAKILTLTETEKYKACWL